MTNGQDRAGEGGPAAATSVEELRAAIRLNPGSAEAYRLLGRALYVSPVITREQIGELDNGVFLGEAGHSVRLYRAALFARLGLLEPSQTDLRQLITDPAVPANLRSVAGEQLAGQLFDRDRKAVELLVDAGNYAAARELLATADGSPEKTPAGKNYQRLESWVDQQDAWHEIQTLSEAKRWAELQSAVTRFTQRFPRSEMAHRARELAEIAAEESAPSPGR